MEIIYDRATSLSISKTMRVGHSFAAKVVLEITAAIVPMALADLLVMQVRHE